MFMRTDDYLDCILNVFCGVNQETYILKITIVSMIGNQLLLTI